MTYHHDRDLHLTYGAARGYWNFVLYIEPPAGPGSAINASQIFRSSTSPYAAEWLERLDRCAPDALHVSLVNSDEAPSLWHPCVYEDPESPSAVAGDGCVCWQTFRDPITWLPVAAHHFRTVSGNHEYWQHYTYAPLSIPDGERLGTLVIDRESGMFWVRTHSGALHIIPERRGAGYGSGYGGGGPAELARFIERVVKSDGYDVAAGTAYESPDRKVLGWVSSAAADRTQELTLDQLKLLCRSGMVM